MRGPTNTDVGLSLRTARLGESTPSARRVDAPPSRGLVTLITGCMFSGKTSALLRRIEAYQDADVLALKHAIDTRYDPDHIVSHAGKSYPARAVSSVEPLYACLDDPPALIAIDEAHFFSEAIVDAVAAVVRHGCDVVLTALNPDSWGRPFKVVTALETIGDEPIRRTAVCGRCGGSADRTQRLTPIRDGNLVGGAESYEPRCCRCWTPPVEPPTR